MYLIAHQDDCQMVVGNVLKIRTLESARESGEGDAVIGFVDSDRNMPRQCTCEPMTVKLVKHIPVDGNGDHNVQWIMPTTLP